MAICDLCHQEMLAAKGCAVPEVQIEGVMYQRIAWGKEGDFDIEFFRLPGFVDEDVFCSDCGAKLGHLHHFGCDMERCPKCNDQFGYCDCIIENSPAMNILKFGEIPC